MKPKEKRTTTEPGLGQVPEGAPGTIVRERATGEDGPPISAPPISGAPPSVRHTRALESVPASAVEPRKPLETKRVDTRALAAGDRISLKPSGGKPVDRRAPTQRENGSDAVERTREEIITHARSQRPADPSEPPRTPRSPAVESGRPAAAAATSARPARSARPSIREDDVGAAVRSRADAVGVAGRQVPRIVRTKAEIAAAPIDHRAGFLLAHIDGVTTVQGLVDIAGMPESELHEILERLRRLGIVAIR